MTKVSQSREQFEAFFSGLIAQLIQAGHVDQACFAEKQRDSWWLVWGSSREALRVTNPFPVLMGDPDAAWAREVAEKSLRAQGLKVVD